MSLTRTRGEKIFSYFNTIGLFFIAFLTIYPFYYILIYSVSDPVLATKGVYLWPIKITFRTYATIFQQNRIGHDFFISISRTVIGSITTVFFCSMLGYAVSKKIMPGRKFFYLFSVVVMYFHAGLIPWYMTMKAYGLKNNFLLYILPLAVMPFYMILLKTYFEQLPESVEESALVEGAGYFTILIRLVLPLSMPVVATIAIFSAVMQWNSYRDNLFLAPSINLETLQYLLYRFLKESSASQIRSVEEIKDLSQRITPISVRMAITIIVTVPVTLVYPFLQKYFMSGIMLGAIKG